MSAPAAVKAPERGTAAWHADRRTYIGGSDAPILTGDDPWRSEYDLWLEKTGQADEGSREENDQMRYGALVEDVVAQIYEQEESRRLDREVKLRRAPRRRHPQYPFIACRLDRQVVGERRAVQIKTAWKPWPSVDDVPRSVYIQIQHEMAVTGYQVEDVGLLTQFGKFTRYEIPRNDILIGKLIRLERAWWQRHVVEGVEPRRTGRHLNALPEGGDTMSASGDQEQAALRLHEIDERVRSLVGPKGDTGLRGDVVEWLKRSMAGATRLEGSGWHVRWKTNKPATTVNHEGIAAAYRALLDALRDAEDPEAIAAATDGILTTDLDTLVGLHTVTAAQGKRPFAFKWTAEEED